MFNPLRVWLLVPNWVRRIPSDLSVVIAVESITGLLLIIRDSQGSLFPVFFGLPFAFFFPGYALTAAAFPTTDARQPSNRQTDESRLFLNQREGIDWVQRITLSVVSSIVIVSLLGLGLTFSGEGLRAELLFISISGLTIAVAIIAIFRSWRAPPQERFTVSYHKCYSSLKSRFLHFESRLGQITNVVVAVSLLLASISIVYGLAFTPRGESFAEFYLLTEQENGDLTASDYQTEFVRGDEQQFVVGVDNFRQTREEYTVIIELQQVSVGNSNTEILQSQTLHRFQTELGPNEDWERKHSVSPTMIGENLRLQYRLYRGNVSQDVARANADREIHHWINVTSSRQRLNVPTIAVISTQRW